VKPEIGTPAVVPPLQRTRIAFDAAGPDWLFNPFALVGGPTYGGFEP
jgi:hypothetical protein